MPQAPNLRESVTRDFCSDFCVFCVSNRFAPGDSAPAAQTQTEKKEVRVWVNTRSGVYHCPSSRWYGKTKQGRYMGECAAQKVGYRTRVPQAVRVRLQAGPMSCRDKVKGRRVFVFEYPRGKLTIPYERVGGLEYGQKASVVASGLVNSRSTHA